MSRFDIAVVLGKNTLILVLDSLKPAIIFRLWDEPIYIYTKWKHEELCTS